MDSDASRTPALAAALERSLRHVADAVEGVGGRWWIVGSAAVALHGADAGVVRDVDVLLEAPEDAVAVLNVLGAAAGRGVPDARFRSGVFGRWEGAELPVEVMADFEVRGSDRWVPVQLATREAVEVGSRRLWVPERGELVELFRSFGRPKDLRRAAALET